MDLIFRLPDYAGKEGENYGRDGESSENLGIETNAAREFLYQYRGDGTFDQVRILKYGAG